MKISHRIWAIAAAIEAGVILAILVLWVFSDGSPPPSQGSREDDSHAGHEDGEEESSPAEVATWTCSMHPQIQLPDPGKCPICHMDLIPLTDEGGGERTMSMSIAARALAEIETAPAERRFVTAEVRMVGKVAYDERHMETIAAWIPGRIERLFVDFTGARVAEGDHLFELYSPELHAAQRELLEARKRIDDPTREDNEFLRASDRRALKAVREKLRLWGLTSAQVAEIEERGTAEDRITIHAPAGGVVVAKHVDEGDYVKTGEKLLAIADLDRMWVLLEAYEDQLPSLHYAQEVAIETSAFPGLKRVGTVAFIDPELDSRSRTVDVRLNVDNPGRRLKPGMFVHATAYARLSADGEVVQPSLAGKWISPMHPEIVKEGPGQCDICGMDLVPAEEFGFRAEGEATPPLVVPETAVLWTGKRGVVYVEKEDADRPTFEGRVVTLGPRAGDYRLIRAGLREGERVVVKGNFKIDSALQIQAKKSMMNPEGGGSPGGHHDHGGGGAPAAPAHAGHRMVEVEGDGGDDRVASSPEVRRELAPVYPAYLALHAALAGDDAAAARSAAKGLADALAGVDPVVFPGDGDADWLLAAKGLGDHLGRFGEGADHIRMRAAFEDVSAAVIRIARAYGHDRESLRVAFCPMAFDNRGAEWLQREEAIANPYFEGRMKSCGEIREVLAPAGSGDAVEEPADVEDDEGGGKAEKVEEPEGGEEEEGASNRRAPDPASRPLTPVLAAYLDLQVALSGDRLPAARAAAEAMGTALAALDPAALPEPGRATWEERAPAIRAHLGKIDASSGDESVRSAFRPISAAMIAIVETVGHGADEPLRKAFCPMAFDGRGAEWLQRGEDVANPYFRGRMKSCGEIRAEIPGVEEGVEAKREGGDAEVGAER